MQWVNSVSIPLRAVCTYFGLDPLVVRGTKKRGTITQSRVVFCWVMKRRGMGITRIAAQLWKDESALRNIIRKYSFEKVEKEVLGVESLIAEMESKYEACKAAKII
jgi:hypothetical protein